MRLFTSIVGLSIIAAASTASADLVYTFDTDAQGWGTLNDARNFQWDDAIGSENLGAIKAVDIGNGQYWYYSAPTIDLGAGVVNMNDTISWDILGITGLHNRTNNYADVMLTGNGIQIGIDISTQPVNGQWTNWNTTINDTSGWKIISAMGTGTLSATDATMTDIQSVLANLDGFYIRGEYTAGGDSTALDNVNVVPAPAGLAMFSVIGVALTRRRR